jgi:hypothetical protein
MNGNRDEYISGEVMVKLTFLTQLGVYHMFGTRTGLLFPIF